jgi:hypothetical protein
LDLVVGMFDLSRRLASLRVSLYEYVPTVPNEVEPRVRMHARALHSRAFSRTHARAHTLLLPPPSLPFHLLSLPPPSPSRSVSFCWHACGPRAKQALDEAPAPSSFSARCQGASSWNAWCRGHTADVAAGPRGCPLGVGFNPDNGDPPKIPPYPGYDLEYPLVLGA